MSARHGWRSMNKDASFASARMLIGGASSVGAIIIVSTGVTAASTFSASQVSEFSSSTGSAKTEVKADTSTKPADPQQDYEQQSYTESSDGTSQTRHYSSSTTDTNGNQVKEERTYTTTIDGGSAIDINLQSNSSSNGTSSNSSNSSTSINISSSTQSFTSTP